ncbi:MAG: condensation domain-containing protein, partial [Kibdelosporangium sp.]
NGFRIEPGEVEAALCAEPGIAAAVVTSHGSSGKALVAHVVARTEGDLAGLRARLAERLPSHLVPAVIVPIDALPLTGNGKVDVSALPGPVTVDATPPRTPRQEVLASLFAETLGVRAISADDDFFALGGNSLSAVRLAGRIQSAMSVRVSVRDVFYAPTVAALEQRLGPAHAAPPPLKARSNQSPVPLSPGQHRLWTVNYLGDHQPDYLTTMALELQGELDVSALRAAVCDVVGRHEVLRTVMPYGEDGPVQHVLPEDPAAVDFKLTDVSEAGIGEALEAELRVGFDLMSQPPLRTRVLRISPQRHLLLLVMHHAAVDGESLTPLRRDLGTAYRSRLLGQQPSWPELRAQYSDYTLWLRDRMGDEENPDSTAGAQSRFWQTTLAGLPAELPLPTDRPRPATMHKRAAAVPFALDTDTHERVDQLARRCAASAYMVLHAAIAVALTELGAGHDVPIGVAVSGRDTDVLDDLVGCMVHTVVVRTDTSGAPALADVIRRVRDGLLAAHDHKEFPFDRLVDLLNPPRSLARHPLFQVVVTYSNADQGTEFAGLPAHPRRVPAVHTDFDLTFQLTELPDGGVTGELVYAEELFDRATAERITDVIHQVLSRGLTE